MPTSNWLSRDSGSAVVEFIVVGLPFMFLAAFVTQVLSVGYLHNVATDAASEGAAAAALANSDISAGKIAAAGVMESLLVPLDYQVAGTETSIGDSRVASIAVEIANPFGIGFGGTVTGRAEVQLEGQGR